jgi:hypothetical protein
VITPAILKARTVELESADTRADWVDSELAGRKIRLPQRKPIWLPKPAGEWAADAVAQVEGRYPGMAPALITSVVAQPLRSYRLVGSADERRVALLGAFALPQSTGVLGSAFVLLRLQERRLRAAAPLGFELVDLSQTEAVLDFLQALALEVTDDDRARRDPDLAVPVHTLWVGGSAKEAGAERWFRLAVAAAEPLGLSLEGPLENPSGHLGEVRRKIGRHAGGPVVLWKPYCGRQYEALAAAASVRVITLEEQELPEALFELRLAVLEGFADVSSEEGQGAETEFSPVCWKQFHASLHRLTDESLVLTDRAREHCLEGNGYADCARMWGFLDGLAVVARAWRAADCSTGARFDEWASERGGIEIALHDSTLSSAAKLFKHNGVEYSREPHVKVDDHKPPNECGRIYFAMDPVGKRLIVDHVGLHL